jgi:mRNA interferase RelE/StbE
VRYRIEFKPSAAKALTALPAEMRRRLAAKIDALAHQPRPRGVKKLVGEENLYRIVVGDYRIVYQIRDEVLLILVVRVGHRRDIYR